MTHIVILGSGFGALTAVRQLRKSGVDADITLVSPKKQLTYLPSLIWMPSGMRKGSDLEIDLDNFFNRQKVTWHQGYVTGLEDGGRTVITDNGTLTNDYLVIATGSRFIKKLPGIKENAIIPCEGVASGQQIADRLKEMDGGTIAIGFGTNPKEPGAVRGGPMFEFLFGIDTLLRRQGRRDKFDIVFFNGAPKPGIRLGEKAVVGLLAEMARRDIKTYLGAKPTRIDADKVVTEREEFPADLVLMMPGLTGPLWLDNTELPRSEGGFIRADEKCRVEGWPQTYVVGDTGSYPGPDWLAKQAHQPDLQAEAAAKNIAGEIKGQTPSHNFKSELVCIVDTLNSGILVYRSEKRSLTLPKLKISHWAKRTFENIYLRPYR